MPSHRPPPIEEANYDQEDRQKAQRIRLRITSEYTPFQWGFGLALGFMVVAFLPWLILFTLGVVMFFFGTGGHR